MKVCTKCHIEKDESEFSKELKCRNGIRTICKSCRNTQARNRQQANPEKYLIKKREQDKKYYSNNYERILKKVKEWCDKNKERSKNHKRQCYLKNKTIYLAAAKDKFAKNKKAIYAKHKERIQSLGKAELEKYKTTVKKAHQKHALKATENLFSSYVKQNLKRRGYTEEQIIAMPSLIDINKVEILVKRINKFLKQKQ